MKYFQILDMRCFSVPLNIEGIEVIIQSRLPERHKKKEKRAKLL